MVENFNCHQMFVNTVWRCSLIEWVENGLWTSVNRRVFSISDNKTDIFIFETENNQFGTFRTNSCNYRSFMASMCFLNFVVYIEKRQLIQNLNKYWTNLVEIVLSVFRRHLNFNSAYDFDGISWLSIDWLEHCAGGFAQYYSFSKEY